MQLKSWLPTVSTILLAAAGAFTPSVYGLLVQHPKYGILIGGVAMLVLHFIPSPLEK